MNTLKLSQIECNDPKSAHQNTNKSLVTDISRKRLLRTRMQVSFRNVVMLAALCICVLVPKPVVADMGMSAIFATGIQAGSLLLSLSESGVDVGNTGTMQSRQMLMNLHQRLKYYDIALAQILQGINRFPRDARYIGALHFDVDQMREVRSAADLIVEDISVLKALQDSEQTGTPMANAATRLEQLQQASRKLLQHPNDLILFDAVTAMHIEQMLIIVQGNVNVVAKRIEQRRRIKAFRDRFVRMLSRTRTDSPNNSLVVRYLYEIYELGQAKYNRGESLRNASISNEKRHKVAQRIYMDKYGNLQISGDSTVLHNPPVCTDPPNSVCFSSSFPGVCGGKGPFFDQYKELSMEFKNIADDILSPENWRNTIQRELLMSLYKFMVDVVSYELFLMESVLDVREIVSDGYFDKYIGGLYIAPFRLKLLDDNDDFPDLYAKKSNSFVKLNHGTLTEMSWEIQPEIPRYNMIYRVDKRKLDQQMNRNSNYGGRRVSLSQIPGPKFHFSRNGR